MVECQGKTLHLAFSLSHAHTHSQRGREGERERQKKISRLHNKTLFVCEPLTKIAYDISRDEGGQGFRVEGQGEQEDGIRL